LVINLGTVGSKRMGGHGNGTMEQHLLDGEFIVDDQAFASLKGRVFLFCIPVFISRTS
jgi:hypothetical protein